MDTISVERIERELARVRTKCPELSVSPAPTASSPPTSPAVGLA
jgi:hypothetical protein